MTIRAGFLGWCAIAYGREKAASTIANARAHPEKPPVRASGG
jgi:hypothetical protein